jgi:hypothetical protein
VRKVRVLIVSPPALTQLIRHLFQDEPEFEVLRSLRGIGSLARRVAHHPPELIVASVKPVGTGLCATALAIKQSSPLSKLILICPVSDLTGKAHKCAADSCLDQEKLVGQLLPTAWTLAHRLAPSRTFVPKTPLRSNATNQYKKDYL